MALDEDGPEEHRLLVARDGLGGDVCGVVDIELFRARTSSWPGWSCGCSRTRVGAASGAACWLRWNRSSWRRAGPSWAGWTRRRRAGNPDNPDRADYPDYEDAAGPFAMRHGFSLAQTMVRRELRLPLSARHARALADSPKARPPGYSLITFLDRWPDELIADRCELGRRMSTDVPMGEQELDEEVWDEAGSARSRRRSPPRTGPR